MHRFVLDEFTQFGTNLIGINPGKATTHGASMGVFGTTRPLSLADSQALERLPRVKAVVPFVGRSHADWEGRAFDAERTFVTGIGSGTTYPDYKPAPFIVAAEHDGVDTVTVVSEGIFSYCGVKVKIDTDRHLGPECAVVSAGGEPVGHVVPRQRRRGLVTDRHHELGLVLALEGAMAREQLVEQDAEGPHVGAGVHGVGAELLR